MKNKVFLFTCLPILAMCLTSCGEGRKVSNYLKNNGKYNDGAYILAESYYSNGVTIACGLLYHSDEKIFSVSAYGTNSNVEMFGIVVFEWGDWKNAEYGGVVEYGSYCFECEYYSVSLGVCPNLNFANTTYRVTQNTMSLGYTDSYQMANDLLVFVELAVAAGQDIINTYIDANINLW